MLLLLDQLPELNSGSNITNIIYTPSTEEVKKAAQNIKQIAPKRAFIHSMIGVQVPEFAALNTELANNEFMELDKNFFSRGGGFDTILPKAHIATLFNFTTFSSNKTEGSSTNSLRGTIIGTSLGIVLLNKPKYQLIP